MLLELTLEYGLFLLDRKQPTSANRRLEEALRTEPAGGMQSGGLLANDSRRQSVG
jgi:hypothetical protein